MADSRSDVPFEPTAPCPICGATAERGCVYASDRGGLFWREGEPMFSKNFFGISSRHAKPLGRWEFLRGVYTTGLRCEQCRHVVLPLA